jgi:hypothetical protein
MKIILAGLVASALTACGDRSGVDADIFVDPPSNESSCVGVAGFEVKVWPTGESMQMKQLVGSAPVREPKGCALPGQFTIEDLDVDTPVRIDVSGYDGTGTGLRVAGTQSIRSLRDGPVHLALEAQPSVPPLLFFYRNPILDGALWSEVESLAIFTQMGSTGLLTVTRDRAGLFFDPEPGAYGVPGLDPTGASKGTSIVVKLTTSTGRPIKDARLDISDWNGTYYTAQ